MEYEQLKYVYIYKSIIIFFSLPFPITPIFSSSSRLDLSSILLFICVVVFEELVTTEPKCKNNYL
jgi:hypothetical protein